MESHIILLFLRGTKEFGHNNLPNESEKDCDEECEGQNDLSLLLPNSSEVHFILIKISPNVMATPWKWKY